MTLRRKLLLILGIIAITTIGLLYAGSWSVLRGGFARLEEQSLRRDVQRLLNALSYDSSELDRAASDWAHWDDTYRFIQDTNPEYQRSNLVDTTFTHLHLNLLLLIDANGRQVYTGGFDLETEQPAPVPASLQTYLSPNGTLLHHPTEDSRIRGIVLLPEGPLLVASRPILTSMGEGPARGTLIMGRYLDARETDKLAQLAQLSVSAYPVTRAAMPSDVQEARSLLSQQTPVLIRPLGPESIAAYALVEDIQGRPALIMRVDNPRHVYRQGLVSVYHFMAWLLFTGLIFGGAILWFSERLVLSRLAHLAKDVSQIGARGDIAGRVRLPGQDELSRLAGIINAMLKALEEAQHELRASEERYRSVITATGEGILLQDSAGAIRTCNASAERILGIPANRMVGRETRELRWHAIREDGSPLLEEMHPAMETLRTGKPRSSVVMGVYRPDGTLAWISMNSQPLFQPEGTIPYAVVTSFADITAHKRAEEKLREREESYRLLADHSTDLISRHTPDGAFVYASPAVRTLLGYEPDELIGRSAVEFVFPDDVEGIKSAYRAFSYLHAPQTPLQPTFSYRIRRKDSTYIWFETTSRAVHDPDTGAVREVIATSRDVTERKRAEEALREANAKLAGWNRELAQRTRELTALNEMSKELQTRSRVEDAYAVIAQALPRLFPDEAGLLAMVSPASERVEVVAQWGNTLPGTRVFMPNDCWVLQHKRARWTPNTSAPACKHLGDGPVASYACIPLMAHEDFIGALHVRPLHADQGQLAEAKHRLTETVAEHLALALANLGLHEKLRSQSIQDPLTHLFNRRYMEEFLERELHRAARNGRPVGVLMLDLDHFKRCNDTYGHEAGDTALREIGEFLQTHIRGEDIVCRYGGEEFTLILPEASLEDSSKRAEALREGIKQLTIEYRDHSISPITASFGVAVFPDHGASHADILRAADAALYQAKAAGRDRVAIARPMNGSSADTTELPTVPRAQDTSP
jgi:diguanylate cyclase (GGDEF)-like protein/PAS domain S-box-containing protein